jgi:glycosyltransferase involved in cell wall biosynthesis
LPALEAIRGAAVARGWSFEAVFSPAARDRPWYAAAEAAGMDVRVCPLTPRRARVRRVASLLAECRGPTILHTHFARWDVAATLAARGARRPEPVVVIWHRHGTLSERRSPVLREVLRFGLVGRLVDAHLCVGPAGYAELVARGAPPRRTLLFPNGIDLDRFPVGGERERARARAELAIPAESKLLAAFVWDWERKGGPLWVELVRELAARQPGVLALMVGAGEHADEVVRRLDVERSVRRAPLRADPRAFFYAADVFVAPSAYEGLGFAPLECVCCGTPVVASDIPGHRYFGAHLPAVRLTPLNATAMADAVIAELDRTREDHARRIAASRDYLAQHAGLDAWVERLLRIYDQALSRHGGSHPPRRPAVRTGRQTVLRPSRS